MTTAAPSAVKGRVLKIKFAELVSLVGGQEAAASLCRVSQSQIQRCCSLHDAQADDYPAVDVVRDLEAAAGQALVTEALAMMADVALIRLPSVARPSDLLSALSDLSREASELTSAICTGFHDGKFCELDARKARSECEDVIARAAQMRALLDIIIGDKE